MNCLPQLCCRSQFFIQLFPLVQGWFVWNGFGRALGSRLFHSSDHCRSLSFFKPPNSRRYCMPQNAKKVLKIAPWSDCDRSRAEVITSRSCHIDQEWPRCVLQSPPSADLSGIWIGVSWPEQAERGAPNDTGMSMGFAWLCMAFQCFSFVIICPYLSQFYPILYFGFGWFHGHYNDNAIIYCERLGCACVVPKFAVYMASKVLLQNQSRELRVLVSARATQLSRNRMEPNFVLWLVGPLWSWDLAIVCYCYS